MKKAQNEEKLLNILKMFMIRDFYLSNSIKY